MIKKLRKNEKGITIIALVITIIVLLILAGVSIAMLTGENGILKQATEAKKASTVGAEKEQISLAMQSLKMKKQADNVSTIVTSAELQEQLLYDGAKNVIVEDGENNKLIVTYQDSKNQYTVDQDGKVEENGPVEQPENVAKYWEVTRKSDAERYSYNDVSNGDKKVKVNIPKLGGNMKAIKYVGPEAETQTGSKWANAMTNDGSMFVWIPRYAYVLNCSFLAMA
ncbi:MAG: type II secretion system protein [Clostridia bacterium]